MPRSSSVLTWARRRSSRALAVAVTTAGLVLGLASAAPAAVDPPPDQEHPVILVGVTGLRWDDVGTFATPTLWDLSRRGAVGAVAARSVSSTACPADGWLAVSAGARVADLTVPTAGCRALRDPADADVPGWADYVTASEEQPFGASPGVLGEILSDSGTAVTGIGPGAAIALADADGRTTGTHLRRPATPLELQTLVRQALETSDLVVVDAGTVRDLGRRTEARPEPAADPPQAEAEDPDAETLVEPEVEEPTAVDAIVEPTRAEQVQVLDERIETVVRAARGSGATILVVSLADSGRATLQLAVAVGPSAAGDGEYSEALLTSGSTRQDGLVQATDVTTTLLAALDLAGPGDAFVGAPLVPTSGPATASARVALLLDMASESLQVTRVSGSYLTRLVLTQAVLFVVAALLLTAGGHRPRPGLRPAMRTLQVSALALGAAPIASFLTDLVPWWSATSPVTAFWLALLGWIAVITATALAGPWRRSPLGPVGVVAGVTVLVLVLDALTGSHLVVDSPMGAHRIMAARFYGISNQAFAMLVAGGVLLATAVAHTLLARGRRGLATLAVVTIGLVVTVVDGAPGLGSDFGGPPALIVAFTLLALVVSGRRPQWRTLLLVMVVAAVVVVGFAWLDWLRPPAERTHIGRFFATVIDGGLVDVVQRKIGVNLRVLTSWRYLVLAIGGVLVTGLVLRGPNPRDGAILAGSSPLAGLRQAVPLLSTAVAAMGLALGIGFLINDSGIVVPATGIAVAVPCLVAAAAQGRLVAGQDLARERASPVAPVVTV